MAEQKLPHCVDLEVSTKHAATVQNPKQMWPMKNWWESVSLSLSLSSLGSWSEPPWDRIFPNGKLDCDAFFLVNKCGKLVNHRCCQLLSTLNQPRASSKIAADCTLNWKIHICTIHQPSWTHFYDIFVVWGADICWYCCMSRLELEDPPEFSISLGLESSSYEPGVNRPTCLFGIEELLLRLSSAKDDDYLNPIAGELENPKVAEWRAPQTCAQSCFLSWPTSLWLCCFGKMRPFFWHVWLKIIGLVSRKSYRKPWFLPWKSGLSCMFSPSHSGRTALLAAKSPSERFSSSCSKIWMFSSSILGARKASHLHRKYHTLNDITS